MHRHSENEKWSEKELIIPSSLNLIFIFYFMLRPLPPKCNAVHAPSLINSLESVNAVIIITSKGNDENGNG